MDSKEFLDQMAKLPKENRANFSRQILDLTKLSVAEVAPKLIKEKDIFIKINALKAIRKHGLDLLEKDILALLLDKDEEVRTSAIKTIASFGKKEHFNLVKSFYTENKHLRPRLIDSFLNYSDFYYSYEFMMNELLSDDENVRKSSLEWFSKALSRDILLPWIQESYANASFEAKRAFELAFDDDLPKLFLDPKFGYRFKLSYLDKRIKN